MSDSGSDIDNYEQLARASLLKEGKKRLTLSDIYGVSAYTRRPPKQTINKNVLNAEMLNVMNHNARWEEDKCYTIKRNIDRLEKQKHSSKSKSNESKKQYEEKRRKIEDEREFWKKQKEEWAHSKPDSNSQQDLNTLLSSDLEESIETEKKDEKPHHRHHHHHHHRHHSKSKV